ncbi:MAG TPA: ribonuclease D [Thermoanaerobaculia bacterium]
MKWISDQGSFDAAIARIGAAKEFAIDTEADSLHSYFDKVCLIQITAAGEDYVIDPLAKIDLAALGILLADPSIRKVLHGADYDLRILNRDFGFALRNLNDTMVCAQLLGYEAIGLAALLQRHFGLAVDKSHQRADWAQRPLSAEMLAYAATDTRHLIELAAILRRELEALGRWEWATEEFERLEQIRFIPTVDEEGWRKLKGCSRLERRPLAAVKRLHGWRDRVARELDRPPFKVLGNEPILEIAMQLPRTEEALGRIKGLVSWHLRKWGSELLAITEEVAGLPEEALPEKVPTKPWFRDKEQERIVDALKRARDHVAKDLRIDSAILAPKHVLSAVADVDPAHPDQLDSIPAMRRWQKALLAAPLLHALGELRRTRTGRV